METEPINAYSMGARGESLDDSEDEPLWFQQLMEIYPKPENRTAACREARRLAPTLEMQATILRAVRALSASERWQKGFAPDARNFLRDRRWRDAEGMPGSITRTGAAGTVYKTKQVKLDLPIGEPCDPEVAKAAMRDGLVESWKERHPDEEPPTALLADPVGYIMGRTKGMPSCGSSVDGRDQDAKKRALAELESVKHRMQSGTD